MINPFHNVAGTGNPNLPANPKNPNWKIFFKHVGTNAQVAFEGWVTDFSDNFTSEWNPTSAYGRMDPLATFQRTNRQINLSFDVPSASRQEAIDNTGNVDLLIKFLYPVYADGERKYGNVLKSSPLVTLKWANLIANYNAGKEEELVGYLNGVNYAPDLDAGFFMVRGEKLFPQLLKVNFTFTVLHTVLPGWSLINKRRITEEYDIIPPGMKGKTEVNLETGEEKQITEHVATERYIGDWQFGNSTQHYPHAGNIPNMANIQNVTFGGKVHQDPWGENTQTTELTAANADEVLAATKGRMTGEADYLQVNPGWGGEE